MKLRATVGFGVGLVVAVAAVLVLGCRTVPKQTDFSAEHAAALAAVSTLPNVAPGSAAEKTGIERLERFLGEMTAEKIKSDTALVYAPDAYLNDTLKTSHGAGAIRDYFLATMDASESVTVKFDDVTRAGDGTYYFRWVMDVRMKKLEKGKTVKTIGITQIRFDDQGRVLLHQDFWDSTVGLFQHVPGIGTGIRAIKARL